MEKHLLNIVMTNHKELEEELVGLELCPSKVSELASDFLVDSMEIIEIHRMSDNEVLFIVSVDDIHSSLLDLIGSYENPALILYCDTGWESSIEEGYLAAGLFYIYDYLKDYTELITAKPQHGE